MEFIEIGSGRGGVEGCVGGVSREGVGWNRGCFGGVVSRKSMR